MKSKRAKFFSVLLILIACAAFFLFVYKAGKFPGFNRFVDSAISLIKSSSEKESYSATNESLEVAPLAPTHVSPDLLAKLQKIDLSNKKAVFDGVYSGYYNENASSDVNVAVLQNDGFSVMTESYTYDSDWRYVSNPYTCFPYAAVFTGEPELQLFEYETGLFYSCPVPVYPDEVLLFSSEELIFKGRDENTYRFLFKDASSKTTEKEIKTPKQFFVPDSKCEAAIKSRLEMWNEKKIDKLPPVSFFPVYSDDNNTSALYDAAAGLSVYAYSPVEQGKYKIGFMDANENWSDCKAFVFIFLSDGEMLTMSFEYYADKPYTEVSLSAKELYYFVCGNAAETEIPENTRFGLKGPIL